MHTPPLGLAACGLALLLGACGEKAVDSPGAPPAGSPLDPATRSELEKAMAGAAASALGRDPASAVPSAEWARRPLTAKDVEAFLAVTPRLRDAKPGSQEFLAAIGEHGYSAPQWVLLSARITMAGMAMAHPPERATEQMKADMEVVRPFVDRVRSAMARPR